VSLNIKNEKVHQLAVQLADLTGESLTQAVRKALELRLERELAQRGAGGKAQRILEFAARFSVGVRRPLNSADHATLLYGEDGLPK
jgi:antitoxin VapB